jgi:fermentation-respiration switch protein FrsA (DUF1100 family)
MFTLILGMAAALILMAGFVRLIEPRFAFFPVTGESVTPHDLSVDYGPFTFKTRDGQELRGWSLVGRKVRARILYFHGNGGNLSVWAPIVADIAGRGYAVNAFDYRGYGLSTGQPTEHGLYRDVEAIVEHFWSSSSTGAPVLYWGRSLGVVMAAYGATIRPPDGLILESGFPDARSLVHVSPLLTVLAWFSSYRFPANDFLNRLNTAVPVLVMHGDDDHVVPMAQGLALFDAITAPKRLVIIRGGDHNDLSPSEPAKYWGAVEEFVESLERRRDH